MKVLFVIIGLSAVPALAQEPRTPIRPADPISVAVRNAAPTPVMVSDSKPAPTIYPNPLPPINLAGIARRLRAARMIAPKAVQVVDTDMLVPEPVRQEEKQ